MGISAIPAIGVIIHKLIKYNKETLAQENPIENISKEPQETIECTSYRPINAEICQKAMEFEEPPSLTGYKSQTAICPNDEIEKY